jgi:hypothetical protein
MNISKEYNKSGIYCILNKCNNKKYIGSSLSMRTRLQRHRSALRGNYHTNEYLQNSWNKYGENNFECFVLEYCEEKDLIIKENYYVNLLSSYNITKDIIRNKPSEKSRKKHSETRKKMFSLNLLPKCNKKIYKYDLNGNFICEYESLKKASEVNKISKSSICRHINGNYKKAGNFLWSYIKYDFLNPYVKSKKEILRNSRSRIVICKSNNEILKFQSIKEASNYFNVSYSNFIQYINKKIKFRKIYTIDLVKSDELRETPEVDNPEPSL